MRFRIRPFGFHRKETDKYIRLLEWEEMWLSNKVEFVERQFLQEELELIQEIEQLRTELDRLQEDTRCEN